MYKHTSFIGATLLAAAILTIGILGNEYFTHIAYAAPPSGGGGHGTGSSTNTASNSVVISGHEFHRIHIGQSIIQFNSCDAGST